MTYPFSTENNFGNFFIGHFFVIYSSCAGSQLIFSLTTKCSTIAKWQDLAWGVSTSCLIGVCLCLMHNSVQELGIRQTHWTWNSCDCHMTMHFYFRLMNTGLLLIFHPMRFCVKSHDSQRNSNFIKFDKSCYLRLN